jgi:hypothetical protein
MRCVRVEVDFGGRPEPALTSAVNSVLASLVVERRPDTGCARENWPGPWTACSAADWVHRVVEEGGYRVVDETGSALVAEGNGRSFYIWTTRNPKGVAAESGNWRRLAVIDGVTVYGDDDLWRYWQAQGYVFWIQEGPSEHSVVPSPAELTRLIEASQTVPPPPS